MTTFYDIQIQWDGKNLPAVWSTDFVDDVCNMRAHVVNPSTRNGVVNITWDTKARDPPQHQIKASQSSRRLSGSVPLSARA